MGYQRIYDDSGIYSSYTMQPTPSQDHTCPICMSAYYTPISLPHCNHIFCQPCLTGAVQAYNLSRCPLCRHPFTLQRLIQQTELNSLTRRLYPATIAERERQIKKKSGIKLIVGNTTTIQPTADTNKYEWTVYVKGVGEEAKALIDKVQFELHETFHPKIISVVPGANGAQVKRWGWGTFRIPIKVYWKKGVFEEPYATLHHDLQFQDKVERCMTAQVTRI